MQGSPSIVVRERKVRLEVKQDPQNLVVTVKGSDMKECALTLSSSPIDASATRKKPSESLRPAVPDFGPERRAQHRRRCRHVSDSGASFFLENWGSRWSSPARVLVLFPPSSFWSPGSLFAVFLE